MHLHKPFTNATLDLLGDEFFLTENKYNLLI